MPVTWITNRWFPTRICFVPDEESWKKVTGKKYKNVPDWNDAWYGWCVLLEHKNPARSGLIAIRIRSNLKEEFAREAIVHEAVHATDYLFKDLGEDAPPGSEFRTYATQAIYKGVLKAWLKSRPPPKS